MEEDKSVELLLLFRAFDLFEKQSYLGISHDEIDIDKMLERRNILLQEFLHPYISNSNAEKSE